MAPRNLTENDIKAIVAALRDTEHSCRFETISREDMEESVKFYKHFNKIMGESGRTFRNAIIVLGVGGLATMIGLGIFAKIKQVLGMP